MSSHPLRHIEITRERRVEALGRWGAPWAGLPLVGLAVATWLVDPALRGAVGALAFLVACLALVLIALLPPAATLFAHRRLRGPMKLAAGRDELVAIGADGRPRWSIPWSELGVAWLRDSRVAEVASASGDEADLTFETPDAAAQAVAALRRRGRDRRAYPLGLESDVMRVWRQSFGWFVPSALAMIPIAAGLWPALPVAIALGWLASRGTRRLRFGADGVLVERRFSRLYVPYREIAAVERRTSAVGLQKLWLRMSDGRRIALGAVLGASRATLAEALLQEGLRMVERGEAAGAGSAALSHEGRDTGEWLESIRSATQESGYRGAALDLDRLLSIARNPAAQAAQRVAAALALRAEPSGASCIRGAAEVSTEPAVREALDALGADALDERRVERALRRLSLAP